MGYVGHHPDDRAQRIEAVMDPNETLREIRALIIELHDTNYAEESSLVGWKLAEKVDALDTWLSKGGFLPREWDAAYHAPVE